MQLTSVEHKIFHAVGMTRVSQLIHLVADPSQSPVKGHFLTQLLPSIHIVHIASILDEELTAYIESNNWWPPKMRPTLNNSISIACSNNSLLDKIALNSLRDDRNRFGHNSNFSQALTLNWASLDNHINNFLIALFKIKAVSFVPIISAHYVRNVEIFNPVRDSDNAKMQHTHIIAVKINEAEFFNVSVPIVYQNLA